MCILTIFYLNRATIPLLIYRTILKYKEKEIEFLKEKQIMFCSSRPFRLTFFKLHNSFTHQYVNEYRQSSTIWYTRVLIFNKTGPLFFGFC